MVELPYDDVLRDEVLKFWFGRVEQTIVPTENRARVWFGEDQMVDMEIQARFGPVLERAMLGDLHHWAKSPRDKLALILVYDQFPRHIYRNSPLSFVLDRRAMQVCLPAIAKEEEHSLSLIERVFFYFPLLHSEALEDQKTALQAYQMLCDLAFSETRVIYDSFYKFATHHHHIVERFGRFPQRNVLLGRESTPEELRYLAELA